MYQNCLLNYNIIVTETLLIAFYYAFLKREEKNLLGVK